MGAEYVLPIVERSHHGLGVAVGPAVVFRQPYSSGLLIGPDCAMAVALGFLLVQRAEIADERVCATVGGTGTAMDESPGPDPRYSKRGLQTTTTVHGWRIPTGDLHFAEPCRRWFHLIHGPDALFQGRASCVDGRPMRPPVKLSFELQTHHLDKRTLRSTMA